MADTLYHKSISLSIPFGWKVRERRSEEGFSQASLAKAVGITRPQLSNIESGRCYPSILTLLAIADTLHVSLDWLFDRVVSE